MDCADGPGWLGRRDSKLDVVGPAGACEGYDGAEIAFPTGTLDGFIA